MFEKRRIVGLAGELERAFPDADIVMELGSFPAVIRHVREGVGIALISRSSGFDVYNQPLQWGTFKRFSGIMDQSGIPQAQQKPARNTHHSGPSHDLKRSYLPQSQYQEQKR